MLLLKKKLLLLDSLTCAILYMLDKPFLISKYFIDLNKIRMSKSKESYIFARIKIKTKLQRLKVKN